MVREAGVHGFRCSVDLFLRSCLASGECWGWQGRQGIQGNGNYAISRRGMLPCIHASFHASAHTGYEGCCRLVRRLTGRRPTMLMYATAHFENGLDLWGSS